MISNFRLTTAAILALMLVVGPALADESSSITIVKSGSTNTIGYAISVGWDGTTTYDDGNDKKQDILPQALTQKLFADVRAAVPFSQMGSAGCMKSVSFGTTTTITYNGDHSPDISCSGNPKSAALYQDALNVQKALGIASAIPRHRPMATPMPAPDSVNQ